MQPKQPERQPSRVVVGPARKDQNMNEGFMTTQNVAVKES